MIYNAQLPLLVLPLLSPVFIVALPPRTRVTVSPAFCGMSFWGIVVVPVFVVLFPAGRLVAVGRPAQRPTDTPGTRHFLSLVGMFVFFGCHVAMFPVIARTDIFVLFMLLWSGRSWSAAPFVSFRTSTVTPTWRGSASIKNIKQWIIFTIQPYK